MKLAEDGTAVLFIHEEEISALTDVAHFTVLFQLLSRLLYMLRCPDRYRQYLDLMRDVDSLEGLNEDMRIRLAALAQAIADFDLFYLCLREKINITVFFIYAYMRKLPELDEVVDRLSIIIAYLRLVLPFTLNQKKSEDEKELSAKYRKILGKDDFTQTVACAAYLAGRVITEGYPAAEELARFLSFPSTLSGDALSRFDLLLLAVSYYKRGWYTDVKTLQLNRRRLENLLEFMDMKEIEDLSRNFPYELDVLLNYVDAMGKVPFERELQSTRDKIAQKKSQEQALYGFGAIAEPYNAKCGRYEEEVASIFARLETFIPAHARILDVGAGRGALSDLFPPAWKERLIQVEWNRPGCRIIREAGGKAVAADASRLPIQDKSVGVVIGLDSFPAFSDLTAFLQEANRVLVNGGKLIHIATEPHPEMMRIHLHRLGIVMGQEINAPCRPSEYSYFDPVRIEEHFLTDLTAGWVVSQFLPAGLKMIFHENIIYEKDIDIFTGKERTWSAGAVFVAEKEKPVVPVLLTLVRILKSILGTVLKPFGDGSEAVREVSRGCSSSPAQEAMKQEIIFIRSASSSLQREEYFPPFTVRIFSPEKLYRMNITEEVRQAFLLFIEGLKKSICALASTGKIESMVVTSCSFTRKAVIKGSDIDDLHIYVSGICREDLAALNRDARENFSMIGGLSSGFGNTFPQIDLLDDFEAVEQRYQKVDKIRMTIYRHDTLLPLRELLGQNYISSNANTKYVCRLRLLLLKGELDAADVEALIWGIRKDSEAYRSLRDCLDNLSALRLSSDAEHIVCVLHGLLESLWRRISILPEEAQRFEDGLYELCRKGLIEIYKGKLVLLWMVHSPEFSDKFWEDQIEVVGPGGEISGIPARVAQRLGEVLRSPEETALWRIAEAGDAQQMSEPKKEELLSAMGCFSVVTNARMVEFVRGQPDVFEMALRKFVLQGLSLPGVSSFHSLFLPSLLSSIRILFHIASRGRKDNATDIARFMYEQILLPHSQPEFIVHVTLSALWKIFHLIGDARLREDLIACVRSNYAHDEYVWIREVSAKFLRFAEAVSILDIMPPDTVVSSLGREAVIIVYNQGIKGVSIAEGAVRWTDKGGSLYEPLAQLVQAAGGGIVVCSAFTETERLIAESGALVKFAEHGWIKYIAHPVRAFNEFYYHFSNPFLWLVHHEMLEPLLMEQNHYLQDDLERYYRSWQGINYRFAHEISRLAALMPRARVLVHDYHLYLVTGMLRQEGVKSFIYHCLYIPWPSPDYIEAHLPPHMIRDIAESLLCVDRVSFLVKRYADYFIETCRRVLGAISDPSGKIIYYHQRQTRVKVNPISCD
ncbi:MAG: trehalose-6-phosphate synthase, partial [Candidatus Omnitrophica bacterium]|nr:trehalose-6-phosphate synthase [Candidatus Omnitrophota bacterium]